MNRLWKQDISTLKALYIQESQNLNQQLLSGADWSALEEKRKLVSTLAKVIDRKANGFLNETSIILPIFRTIQAVS